MTSGDTRDEVRATSVVYPPKGDQDTDQLTLCVAGDHDEWLALLALIDRFVSRYTNPKTSHKYRAELTALFRHVGVTPAVTHCRYASFSLQ